MVAILSPIWSGSGSVKILHPDLSLWKQYDVALMPMDLKLEYAQTPNQDLVSRLR